MKIGILGSGLMGSNLGRLWARQGHKVMFSYAKTPGKLARLASEAGAASASVAMTAEACDVLLLAVHWSRVQDVLQQAGDLGGKIVLNCCVPLDETNTSIVCGMTTSGGEALQHKRPKARWVSCFNTVPSEAFEPVYASRDTSKRPQVLLYGDDEGAKEVARWLVRDIGFEPLEAGAMSTGRFVEPFAMVTAELAYGQPGGPALTYRFDKLN